MHTSSATRYNDILCRFIFVDFNAWEYAGSDNLWAAIVTNLSRAIETEFGIVTSRLFRLITVEAMQCSSSNSDVTNNFLVKLPTLINDHVSNQVEVETIMKDYGVVRKFKKIEKEHVEDGWWEVQYSNSREAEAAFEALKLKKIEVKWESDKVSNNSSSSSVASDVTLQNGRKRGSRRWAMFCHFLDHCSENPKKSCGMNLLGWWILGGISITAILVAIVILAGDFDLDVNRVRSLFF